MKQEIVQLVNAIRLLINTDVTTLMQHAEDKEYIKSILRDSSLEEEVIKLQITAMSKLVEKIKYDIAQGTMSLSDEEEKWLRLSDDILCESKIEHKMEGRF